VANPEELLTSLAMTETAHQVYAQALGPRTQRVLRTFHSDPALEAVQTFTIPFIKRPANSVVDALTTYTGLRVPVDAARVINSRFGAKERRAFNRAVARGGVGWAIFGLGALLAAAGLMTPAGDEDKPGIKNVEREAGYQPGALHIHGRYYRVGAVPFAGWLLAAGATYQLQGAHAIPSALVNMIGEHPLLRGLVETGKTVDEATQSVKQGRAGEAGREAVGQFASRLVPSPIAQAAEAMDTKERDVKGNAVAPIENRIPGLRNTLPVQQTVFGHEVNKSRLSVLDPFRSTEDKGTVVTHELQRLNMGVGFVNQDKEHGESEADYKARRARTGQKTEQALTRLLSTAEFKDADDDGRRELIRSAINTARGADWRGRVGEDVQAAYDEAGHAAYHAPSKLKIGGKERELSAEQRAKFERHGSRIRLQAGCSVPPSNNG
jgi:hypothetical protein